MYDKCRIYKNKTKKSDSIKQTGNLSITVHNKLTNEPVPFAVVIVYYLVIRGLYGESGEATQVARHVSDENGKIPLITLPIIHRSETNPYNQYYMTVNHFRYYPVNIMNIQIYPNVTTEYNILLTPLTASHPDYEFIITPEII